MARNQKQAVLLVALLCLNLCTCVSPMPICAYGHAGCQLVSLANLFDRVIQHSARMHGLSSDLHSELEKYVLPGKNQIGSVYRKCHTSSILTPNGKETAQKLAHEELTEVILKLLTAWKYPLSLLPETMSEQQDFISSKALEMNNIALELRQGVEKVMEKMQLLGMFSSPMNSFTPPDDFFPASGEAMSESELLYCFRRDSDKVQNYLKILKCRLVAGQGC
ncbi:prolactin 2 [Clarias gariepinus]|uniref:prolactin 2 n=1 Tax=Clarias gariepinus TaxID=13013 RepID=UPI00234C250B|nr:prolactin 2 [Clarias gariepinus]